MSCWSAGYKIGDCSSWCILLRLIYSLLHAPQFPSIWPGGGASLTLICSNMHFYHSWASAAILFVLLAISGLCYLIHTEDDSHIVIWGMKTVVEDPPLPCQHIQTHIHNSAFVPSCLLYSHCWGYFLITRAHAPNPGVPKTACPAARLRWGEDEGADQYKSRMV